MTRALDLSLSNSITSAVKDSYAHWKTFMGIPQEADRIPSGLRAMGRLPADEAWVYTVTSILALAAQSVDLRVQVKQGAQWVDSSMSNDSAAKDLQRLVDDVNPEWDGNELQTYIEAADVVHGGCYVRKVRGKFGGRPQELYWLPAPNVEPVWIGGSKLITHYDYRADDSGQATRYPARDVIPFRRFNLTGPTTIVSPWEAARYDITTSRRAAEWNASLLGNYGIPPGAWIADKDADFTPTELNSIKRALRAIRGQSGAGKIPVLPGGLTWQPLSMNQKDADWLASRKVSRMTVCAIAGVPLVIAGDDEHAGVYAGSRDAERIMWRKTLIPKLKAREARWDSWLVPDFDKSREKLRLRYDTTNVEALLPPPGEDHAAWQHWVDRGVPINRAISRFHLGEPLDDGDKPTWERKAEEAEARMEEERVNFERENTGEENKPRTESYRMQGPTGREAIRSLGKKLYKHEAVKAYIDGGDASALGTLVAPEQVSRLAEGLRRRYSAEQIADGTDDWPGLAPEKPEPPVVVNVTVPPASAPAVTFAEGSLQMQAQDSFIEGIVSAVKQIDQLPPIVHVHVPEQAPPVVNIEATKQEAPVVNVTAPEPKVQDIRIVSMPRTTRRVKRDLLGQVVEVTED